MSVGANAAMPLTNLFSHEGAMGRHSFITQIGDKICGEGLGGDKMAGY